jgi:hypothetical protein
MCNVQALITNGLLRMAESDGEVQEETLTFEFVLVLLFLFLPHVALSNYRARKEHGVFQKLLRTVPRLTERLIEASDEESMMMADFVRLTVAPGSNPLSHPL